MKIYMFIFMVTMMLTGFYAQAKNPGESAMGCLKARTNNSNYDNLEFKNRCNTDIFVVWCGDLKYSDKQCGKGKNFYTHSANIRPHGNYTTTIKSNGSFKYASCKGKIGFGTKGITHPSSDRGRFRCD